MKEFVQPSLATHDPGEPGYGAPDGLGRLAALGSRVAGQTRSLGLGTGPVARWVVFAALAMTGISVLLGQITRGALGG